MDNSGLTTGDLALMSNGGGFGGGNSFFWIFALLLLAGGFGNGWGFGGNNGFANAIGYENLATQAQVNQGFDTQNMISNQRETLAAVNNGTAQAIAATNQTFHDTLGIVQSRYDELARDISGIAVGQANLLANQNECCCSTKQAIMQNNYDGAMRDAATNANLTAQIQSVKDMIAQNKIESLQAQVNQLQLAQATSGVLRFPNQWSYGAGAFPPIFGCCGQGNI